MTLLQAFETECANLSTRTRFIYVGDLDEANATIFDQIEEGEFPVCLILAFDIVDGDRANGVINSTAEVNALFLDKLNNTETVDKPTTEIESQIIAPMRALTREFINRMDENDIIHGTGITSLTNRNTWQPVGDAHLYGNWGVFTIEFSEEIATCPPD